MVFFVVGEYFWDIVYKLEESKMVVINRKENEFRRIIFEDFGNFVLVFNF